MIVDHKRRYGTHREPPRGRHLRDQGTHRAAPRLARVLENGTDLGGREPRRGGRRLREKRGVRYIPVGLVVCPEERFQEAQLQGWAPGWGVAVHGGR